ncbi:MAG: tetratricopeptide repeat protein [Halopseudomonas aestusnigri]
MKRLFALVLFSLSLSVVAPAFSADLHKGEKALSRGDFPAALEELMPLAEQGNAKAMYYLGVMYKEGQGVVASDELAHKWLLRAAEQGDAQGQLIMGMMYHFGSGVPENMDAAKKWYQLAADQGVEEAQGILKIIAE